MSTVITVTGRHASVHGRHIEHFTTVDQVVGAYTWSRHGLLAHLTVDRGLDHEHAVNVLDEALVSPVSLEVDAIDPTNPSGGMQ